MSETSRDYWGKHRKPTPGEWPPAGMVIVHNFAPTGKQRGNDGNNVNGFRYWAQGIDDDPPIKVCSCGWSPQLGDHYEIDRESHRWK
jgi:hypothetical protein